MTSYRVTVTYLVEVVDREALLTAGAEAWQAGAGGAEQPTWAVTVEDDGRVVVEASADEADAVRPDEAASVALIVGHQAHPIVPGVHVATMGVDAVVHGS